MAIYDDNSRRGSTPMPARTAARPYSVNYKVFRQIRHGSLPHEFEAKIPIGILGQIAVVTGDRFRGVSSV
jgi:hypothetical protein